jgi:amidohydrolase
MNKLFVFAAFFILTQPLFAQPDAKLLSKLDQQAKEIETKIIEWRRHFHQYPELSNQEKKTGKRIAEFLQSLGIEVKYPVAKTGVVGLLKGGKPGPVVALRADMDALPVTERNSLSFISKERVQFNGQETGVMHACGHDGHMAILMGVAEILSKNKAELKGTVKFFFQPAEEGAPASDGTSGAELMIQEGVMENPKVDAVFGLHIQSLLPSGKIAYRAEGLMAAVDGLQIKVTGKGAHGATPWDGVDPVYVASQIVTGLQGIVSRQTELTKAGVVITIGSIHAGNRGNIIPETAVMEGTIRTFDDGMQKKLHERIKETTAHIAEAYGAKAEATITRGYPVTYNDPALTQQMAATLQRVAGKENIILTQAVTMAEDFSFFQQKAPGVFIFLGAYPAELKLEKQPVHHTADFMIDEKSFVTGVRALLGLTLDYMYGKR